MTQGKGPKISIGKEPEPINDNRRGVYICAIGPYRFRASGYTISQLCIIFEIERNQLLAVETKHTHGQKDMQGFTPLSPGAQKFINQHLNKRKDI